MPDFVTSKLRKLFEQEIIYLLTNWQKIGEQNRNEIIG